MAIAVRFAGLAMLPGGIRDSDDLILRYRPIAESVLAGHGFSFNGYPTAVAPPLYPLFVAACQRLFGGAAGGLRLPLLVIDLGCVLLVWALGRRLLGPRRGLIAGLLAAMCPYSTWTIALGTTEPLFLFIHTGFLLAFVVAEERPTAGRGAVAGAVLGLATLTRAVPLLLPAFLAPLWFVRAPKPRRRAAAGIGAFLGVFLAVLSPWIVRNTLLFHRFIPVQTLGAYHLYMATFDDHDSSFETGKQAIQQQAGRTETAQDRYLRTAASRIVSDPAHFLRLAARRQIDMWSRTCSGRFEKPLLAANGLLLFAALAGWFRAGPLRRRLLPLVAVTLYYIGLHTLLFALFRYLLPVIPALLVLAAAGWPERSTTEATAGTES